RQLYVEEESPQEVVADADSPDVGKAEEALVVDVVENNADAVDAPDAGRCGIAGEMAPAVAEIRLQDVRVDSGQYTTTGSDSDDEEDPWELQPFDPDASVGPAAILSNKFVNNGINFILLGHFSLSRIVCTAWIARLHGDRFIKTKLDCMGASPDNFSSNTVPLLKYNLMKCVMFV
uniref:DDE_Tnp_1_7 domain-containing protein n=1 Tax=Macrostomum lignano TaxID=282301 RepID=A0A1I8JGY6_9PLAT